MHFYTVKGIKTDLNTVPRVGFVRRLSTYHAVRVQQQDGTHGHCRGVWPLVLALQHGPQGSGMGEEGGGKDVRQSEPGKRSGSEAETQRRRAGARTVYTEPRETRVMLGTAGRMP